MGSGSGNFGLMMTLAQLSALSPDPIPSGEIPQAQAQRILTGINETLQNGSLGLATGTSWNAVWLALTQDGGNLCYIAMSTQNEFAVCCRGTQFNSLVDLGEDMNVGNVAQFNPGPPPAPLPAPPPLLVAQGSMKAFAEITSVTGVVPPPPPPPVTSPTLLVLALSQLVSAAGANPTVYITGHSLGGAMATMIAMYLIGQPPSAWGTNTPNFQVYTFAAPSAGLASFASYYDQVFATSSWRVYNAWDAVPYAWQNLPDVQNNFYPCPSYQAPDEPGPCQTVTVEGLLAQMANAPNGNQYVQTNATSNSYALSNGVYIPDPVVNFQQPTTADFLGQIAYQHNCYLQLIGVPALPAAGAVGGPPQVTSISPNNGPLEGGILVAINGGNFTSDCVVDFGTVQAQVQGITNNGATINVTQPAGIGTVDVRVTNKFGASAVTSADQFATPTPLAPTVVSVTPIAAMVDGALTYQVLIVGTGFVAPSSTPTSVSFGAAGAGANVQVLSLTEITVTPPAGTPGTLVDVQVTNDLGASAVAPPGDQFLFGTPIVTGLTPSSGGAPGGIPVTIMGLGFAPGCTVTFNTIPKNTITPPASDVTPTAINVTLPNTSVPKNLHVFADVTVTNAYTNSPTSETTPNDLFTYYSVPKFGSGN